MNDFSSHKDNNAIIHPLPHYEEYEQNIIGNILSGDIFIDEVNLTPDDFYQPRERAIYEMMLRMKQDGIPNGELEVYQYAKENGLDEKIGGLLHLGNLRTNALPPHNIEYQVSKLREATQKRELWEKGHRLVQAIENRASEETIINLKDSISEISPVSSVDFESYSLQPSDLENLERVDLIKGIIPKGSFILLAGKYDAGKSIISLGVAKKVFNCDESVTYIDADMPLQVIEERLAKSNLKDKLGSHFMYLHRSKCSMKIGDRVWTQFLSYMKGKPHCLVILDNLKDLTPPGVNINLDSEVMPLLDEIKKLRDYGHTVILLHHWGREGSNDNPFKNSGSIGDAVDVGYTIQNDGTMFMLKCFKGGRISVKSSLAFKLDQELSLIEVAPPELEQKVDDMVKIYNAISELESQGSESLQKTIIEQLNGILGKKRVVELLEEGESKFWNLNQGSKNSYIYSPINLKIQKSDTIYSKIFSILENGNHLGELNDDLEPPPDFLQP